MGNTLKIQSIFQNIVKDIDINKNGGPDYYDVATQYGRLINILITFVPLPSTYYSSSVPSLMEFK